MAPQGYERVPENERELSYSGPPVPGSPPPSFRSRASSPSWQLHSSHSNTSSGIDRTLADTFDGGIDSEGDDEDVADDRQLLTRNIDAASPEPEVRLSNTLPRMTEITEFVPPLAPGARASFNGFSMSNDGVFANLNAKPERGEKLEEQPPSYEQAAADATPPYWETTIMAPGRVSDEVYIDGLPVGSFFSFAWNGIISMAFQLPGFILTYLLHTTHAAKNGSRAGLGVTLINYGFTMKTVSSGPKQSSSDAQYGQPSEPNSHDFDPAMFEGPTGARLHIRAQNRQDDDRAGDWFAYVLMIVGWIVLIKAVSDFVKARRHEQLVLQSPDRGLTAVTIGAGETVDDVV